jgi:hypothetical protein
MLRLNGPIAGAMGRSGGQLLAVWFSISLLCAPLLGIDRDRRLSELYHTSWTMKDGRRPIFLPSHRPRTAISGWALRRDWCASMAFISRIMSRRSAKPSPPRTCLPCWFDRRRSTCGPRCAVRRLLSVLCTRSRSSNRCSWSLAPILRGNTRTWVKVAATSG